MTVLEVPPMKVAAVRVYENTRYGLRTAGEVWANGLDQSLARRLPIPKNQDLEKAWEELSKKDIDDVRVLTYTQPKMVTGVPKKVADRWRPGGWSGPLPRGLSMQRDCWEGRSLSPSSPRTSDHRRVRCHHGKDSRVPSRGGGQAAFHKNSKHRRMIGFAPKRPGYVRPQVLRPARSVPSEDRVQQADPQDWRRARRSTPRAGSYITATSGTTMFSYTAQFRPHKRLIRLRDPVSGRHHAQEAPGMVYVSTESKQGPEYHGQEQCKYIFSQATS